MDGQSSPRSSQDWIELSARYEEHKGFSDQEFLRYLRQYPGLLAEEVLFIYGMRFFSEQPGVALPILKLVSNATDLTVGDFSQIVLDMYGKPPSY